MQPLAVSANGIPIGVQLVAGYGREDLLFHVAAQIEVAMPWKHRTPQEPPFIAARTAAERTLRRTQ